MSSRLRTAASKIPVSTKVLRHVCASEPERWNHGEKRRLSAPVLGSKIWTSTRGPHQGLLLRRTLFWGPKFGPQNGVQAEWCFWSRRVFQGGFPASKPRSGLRLACPCLCPFCLVVTLILADSFAFSRTGETLSARPVFAPIF